MDSRSAVQSLWRAACGGLAGLGRILAEADTPEEAVFHAPPRDRPRAADAERRLAEARNARGRAADGDHGNGSFR